MPKLDEFVKVFSEELAVAVKGFPCEYGYPPSHVPFVVVKMRIALEHDAFNPDGRAMKATCKRLGIKTTRKAIREFLKSDEKAGE